MIGWADCACQESRCSRRVPSAQTIDRLQPAAWDPLPKAGPGRRTEMRLADDDIREVLARAVEIQSTTLQGDALNAELEAVIQAAEEVGIARPAVERALRE